MQSLSLLPPIAALALAFWTRNVVLSLILGLAFSEALMLGGGAFAVLPATLERVVEVLTSPGDAAIILFCLLVGSLIALMKSSGGIAATVERLTQSGLVTTQRSASLATAIAGLLLFIETNISLLTAGILGRPLFDKMGLSRERLAYIIDSTCSPVSVLILLNGWGAYALGLVGPYVDDQAVSVVAGSIPLNFYALITIALVFFTAWTGRVFGPMAKLASKVQPASETDAPTRAIYMIVPGAILVFGTLGFMLWTGGGNILDGDGAKSVLFAVSTAILALLIMLTTAKRFQKRGALTDITFSGASDLLPATTVILLSLALGDSLRALGTGEFVASLATAFPAPFAFPALIFLAAAGTSFAVGTSWGTYGILVPVALPLAIGAGIPPSLMLAAVLGGGVFGDHASPISDTTLISSLAAGCDHIDHVRTQLPYALFGAGLATLSYLAAGLITV